jgi:hypothetical protein
VNNPFGVRSRKPASDGEVVGIRGQKYDRDVELGANASRGLDPVHTGAETNIHQDQIRLRGLDGIDGEVAAANRSFDQQAHARHAFSKLFAKRCFVFNDQHSFTIHRWSGTFRAVGRAPWDFVPKRLLGILRPLNTSIVQKELGLLLRRLARSAAVRLLRPRKGI